MSEETKAKISSTLKTKKIKIVKERECCICHKIFNVKRKENGRLSESKVCSNDCHKKLISINSKNTINKVIQEGRHKGWIKRNISSYPELFWEKVLDNNNIRYKREYKVCNKYFLDFFITKNDKLIDLEIDGKQHKERKKHDEIRDKTLIENDFVVYRIEWNEIKSNSGKEKMKNKILTFLNWYDTL